MNKKEKGKYKLEVDWNGRRHTEWYTDKSRAIARKEELENYRDEDCPNFSPFSNIKIEFVSENKLPFKF
jgi:hypothetical protein